MGLIEDIKNRMLLKNGDEKHVEVTTEPDINTDTFSDKEQKEIVKLIIQDIEADEKVQNEWLEKKKKALQHYNCEKPSILENIAIRAWQSDRNLGICPSICDAYQSTLLATCWNPDSIHFVATEENDIDNKDNLERFAKWMVGKSEVNVTPEVDDYIQNKITQGFSIFEVYWQVWFEWIDRKIPKGDGTYEIKTEKKRFERGVLENIDNLDDILIPRYGDDIQKLPHIMRILHLTGDKILELGESGVFTNVDSKFVLKLMAGDAPKSDIEQLKGDDLGLADVVDEEYRALPIDVYRWYGYYTKNGRRERYRFLIERKTETFLSGKPLRKIMRTGKYPFVAGPFDRIPGELRGKDLPTIIKDPVNAINLVFNQKSDFQYITNVPFGFHKAFGEGYTNADYKIEPGVSYVTEGNPSEEIYFPNLQRSMAWAQQDFQLLFEVIEKRTGAASYFSSNDRNADNTATRDTLVARNSETRFGKWVMRTQDELAEAITMLVNLYQDNAPKELGSRVLGEDGKRLFPNLSVETLRYNADARLSPDIIAGSKAYERQVALWAFGALNQTIWLDPRVNPKGNWLLTSDTMKKQGIANPERYLPPEPKPEMGTSRTVDNIWSKIAQGEVVEPEENWNIPEILAGLYKKKEEKYFDLDPEYRPNLDMLIFKTEIGMRLFMKKVMEERAASELAKRAIVAGQPTASAQPMGQPIISQPGEIGGAMPPNMGQVTDGAPAQPTQGMI